MVFTVSVDLLPFGSFPHRQIGEIFENSIDQPILENAPQQTGATNVVTSVVWGYRGYDTLGEVTVLFTAAVGVMMLFSVLRRQGGLAGMTVIVRTIARLLFPFTVLLGIYIVIHGHLAPGGGFPGGVIIAASVVMLILACGTGRVRGRMKPMHAEVLESAGGLTIVVLGLLGLVLGAFFLQNVFPLGELGQLFSAGNLPLLYLGASVKVAAGILLIFYSMLLILGGEEE